MNKNVIIIWIPSHQGIIGNEKTDNYFKEATSSTPSEIETPIPYQELVNYAKTNFKKEWNQIWTTVNTSKIHSIIKEFYQHIPTSNLSRKERILLARLRTGHTKITHEYLIKKTVSPSCTICNKLVTVQHLLLNAEILIFKDGNSG